MVSISRADPTSLGFSAERLARIDAFLQQQYVDSGKLPGALCVVARKGQVAHVACVGHGDVERKKALKEVSVTNKEKGRSGW